jgi:hypothetical protein
LRHLAAGAPAPVTEDDFVDPERAAPVLRTVADILAGGAR